MNTSFYKLMLVTQKQNKPLSDYLHFIHTCTKAGITAVQLREKNLSPSELFEFSKHLQHILKPFNIPLIVNDHIDLAAEINAEGVHLGQTDGNVRHARSHLGKDKIIGVTVNNIEQLEIANELPIDYVGVGAIFPTQNKKDVETVWGCEGLKKIKALSKHPIIAIGGITEHNAADVVQAGADGIAAIGAFHDANDPFATTQELITCLNKFNQH